MTAADVRELLAQPRVQLERRVGAGRILHVDAHEVRSHRGRLREPPEILHTEFLVDREAQMRGLHVDVAIELTGANRLEHRLVLVRRRLGLTAVGHEFSEHADFGHEPLTVQAGHGGDELVHRLAGDVGFGDRPHVNTVNLGTA